MERYAMGESCEVSRRKLGSDTAGTHGSRRQATTHARDHQRTATQRPADQAGQRDRQRCVRCRCGGAHLEVVEALGHADVGAGGVDAGGGVGGEAAHVGLVHDQVLHRDVERPVPLHVVAAVSPSRTHTRATAPAVHASIPARHTAGAEM